MEDLLWTVDGRNRNGFLFFVSFATRGDFSAVRVWDYSAAYGSPRRVGTLIDLSDVSDKLGRTNVSFFSFREDVRDIIAA